MDSRDVNILFVDDDSDAIKFVDVVLKKVEDSRFHIIPRESGEAALEELKSNDKFDLVIMDYFLPGMNGLDTAKAILEQYRNLPVIFLTVNRDMNLAIEAMKLGVADYILKEDLNNAFFVQTIVGVLEKQRLRNELSELEVRKRRLEAIQESVLGITAEIGGPLNAMKDVLSRLIEQNTDERAQKYLKLMKDNVDRIEQKMEKLKNLKEDKTVNYIKDIKMIDLS
ncbi:MAG TPA: response regulator [Bacteroidota bacterium]|nr:response regulator [Bacteroidota bacterium]